MNSLLRKKAQFNCAKIEANSPTTKALDTEKKMKK